MTGTVNLAPTLVLGIMILASAGLSCADGDTDFASAGDTSTSITSPAVEIGITTTVRLPTPNPGGPVSLEDAIQRRRSVREFTDEPLSMEELGQLLWAAQGITSDQGARAAPSAGGTYPLELYVAAGRVTGLEPGVYHYHPQSHALELVATGDVRARLMEASLDQACVGAGAVDMIIAAVYERTMERYGERGVRYVHLEAGHAAQNLCLQAVALGLGAVTVGAFSDEQVQGAVGLGADEEPLYVIPVGKPQAFR